MQKAKLDLKELKLVGITTRTSNSQIMSQDPASNPIVNIIKKYSQNELANKINNRKKPGTTFCVYTNYESDFNGEYTYFIGEEVISLESQSKEFDTLIIPAQNYVRFTNQPGQMPGVCIDMWQKIWQMKTADLGSDRAYIADFEIHDERSVDSGNAVLDIYIGVH